LRLICYTSEQFELLQEAALKIKGNVSLRHRPFVDYYYASRDSSRLYLFLDDSGTVQGSIGIETLPFEYQSRSMSLAVASNFHALQPGVGGYLFLHWLRSCPIALEVGGSEDAHKIIRQQKWTHFPSIKVYSLNEEYRAYSDDNSLRAVAKWVLRKVRHKKLSDYASRFSAQAGVNINVREEFDYREDLLPTKSPFAFRLAPTVDFLAWRYNTRLSFVRYRLFRILAGERSAGYVIINDGRERVLIAQCDADDAITLVHGVLLALSKVGAQEQRPRMVRLTSSNPEMSEIYRRFGFVPTKDWTVAMGGRKGPVDMSPDTSNWLINLDWADIGLLGPFLDQPPQAAKRS
jgi:hypothetical protein